MRERDISDVKKKIEAAQPQKKYKYIIPYGHPHHNDNTNGKLLFELSLVLVTPNRGNLRLQLVTELHWVDSGFIFQYSKLIYSFT